MNIYALCVVKNEADIIRYTLKQAAKWATNIFVLDNGSTDGTWEIIQRLGKKEEKIVPWKQTHEPFYEGIRGELYNQFRHVAKPGDWWCHRLDADEVYGSHPEDFLKNVPSYYDYVAKKSIDYVLTYEDIATIDFESYSFEDTVTKIKHVLPHAWIEKRFFRHKLNAVWKENDEVIQLAGMIYPKTIPVKHYQYRSPQQIQQRLDTRIASKNDGSVPKDGKARWVHVREHSWKDLIYEQNQVLSVDKISSFDIVEESNPVKYAWYKVSLKFVLNRLRFV